MMNNSFVYMFDDIEVARANMCTRCKVNIYCPYTVYAIVAFYIGLKYWTFDSLSIQTYVY